MTEKIEPALTPKEWQAIGPLTYERPRAYDSCVAPLDSIGYVIALNNAALPDSDPRKITRATIAMLRRKADVFHPTSDSAMLGRMRDIELDALADALESYLPPEKVG